MCIYIYMRMCLCFCLNTEANPSHVVVPIFSRYSGSIEAPAVGSFMKRRNGGFLRGKQMRKAEPKS